MDITKLPQNFFALVGMFVFVFFVGFLLPLFKAVLKSMERNTDRVVESNDKIGSKVEVLKETLTERDHRYMQFHADREERFITRITEAVMAGMSAQQAQTMQELRKVLAALTLLTDGRMAGGGVAGASQAHSLLEAILPPPQAEKGREGGA
jgi:hypothetical protein